VSTGGSAASRPSVERTSDGVVGVGVVGVGVVGVGFMGRTHLASYASTAGCAIRAVFDPAQRQAAAGNLITGSGADAALATLPRAASLEELLSRTDIDLVSICTPTDTHVALVRSAIRAGKHVLVEKPAALDARQIEELDREARAAGVLAMPAHCMRFWPAWTWMADAVRTARFGRAVRASFRRLGARPSWSQDFYLDVTRSGGAAIDLHIHDADFVRFAFGEPDEVASSGSRMHLSTRYHFHSGPSAGLVAEAEGGWMDDPGFAFMMVASIQCERAMIDFRLGREHELVVLENGVQRPIVAGADYPAGSGYDHEIAALVAAIRSGAREAPVTLADAAATQRLLDRELGQL
jgi:predicted dehydrogenase